MTSVSPDQPVLRIVRGEPSPDELAAVTVLLMALARSGSAGQPEPPSGWSDLSLRLRRAPLPGPGAWRNSAWS